MSETSEASVAPRELEQKVPEKNYVEKGNPLFYALKKSTRESKIARHNQRSERSLDLRARRAELYKKIVKTNDSDERKALLGEAHARDEIEAQYLSQGEISVDISALGEQTARYTMIEPPLERRIPEQQNKPTIFLIPGIQNDIDSVGSVVKEIPFLGRNIVVVGMPDSRMGHVTAEFANAVGQSSTMEPYTQFFKAAIDGLVGKDGPFELWGYSSGAMIAAEILKEEQYQQRVDNAVLFSPAGTADRKRIAQNIGIASEGLHMFRDPGKGAHYSLTLGRNELHEPRTEEEKANADKAFASLREKFIRKSDIYDGMKVSEGGQIIVVSGQKDNITKSRLSDNYFRENEQVKVISLPEGTHNTPIIDAPSVVPKIFETQSLADVSPELFRL